MQNKKRSGSDSTPTMLFGNFYPISKHMKPIIMPVILRRQRLAKNEAKASRDRADKAETETP